jgi:hypothetical protein
MRFMFFCAYAGDGDTMRMATATKAKSNENFFILFSPSAALRCV